MRYHKIGEGPPLLVLHGWGSRAAVMLPLGEKLSDIRTNYIPDLPGFGESPPPAEPWSVDDYADLIDTFSKQVMGEPADVLAHSFGGRITLKWCARTNETGCTKKMVITAGAGMKPRRNISYYRRRVAATVLKAPLYLLPGALKQKAMNRLRGSAVWKSLGSTDYRQLEGVMRETFVKTISEHLDPCLPDIKHEILLLWGKNDRVTPLYQARRMEKGLQNGVLVEIDYAGHYAFLDQPHQFHRIVRAFFENESKM